MNAAEKNKQYVLVVDPDVNDRLSTCMLLLRFGRNIFTAGTAEEAIKFIALAPPAAVVAAEPAGSALLARVKNDFHFSNVPLILLSSSPDPALKDRARGGEFAACLGKPLNAEEFYRVVQAIIEKGPRRKIRIPLHAPAALDDERGGRGHVTMLSEDGLFFRTLELRPVHTVIPLSFELAGRVVRLGAAVLYTTTFEEGPLKEPGMGMKFVKISPEDRDLIKTYILEKVKE